MSGLIKISAATLQEMSDVSRREQGIVQDIISAAQGAVSSRADWQSTAAQDFRDLWNKDKQILDDLQHDLGQWSQYCANQVPIANRVNQPFR